MIISFCILLIAYSLIVIEKPPKVAIAMLGAALTLVFGLIPPKNVFHHVDFGVIFLLVSMMIIVHIADRSGVFRWLSIEMLKLTGGQPKIIFLALCLFTAVLSAFLDNVTTVILVIPITFIISKELKIDPVPLFIAEIIASNIGGTATLIGDPPNIIIGSAANLSFMDFARELTPVITVIFIVCTLVLLHLFRKDLVSTPELMAEIKTLDNSNSIKDRPLMIRSVSVLLLVIAGFILHDLIHVEAYKIAFLGASVLLLFETPKQIIHEIEWTTIFFFIGLFIIIGGLVETGGIKFLADKMIQATHGNIHYATMLVLWTSGFLSAIVDNIPYTATMVPLINQLKTGMDVTPLWWSLSLGACLGGNATIIGAAANIIIAETSNNAGHKISFLRFMKYGLLVTLISLVISSIYLYFRFPA